MQPLRDLVEKIQHSKNKDRDVPHFDPLDGGPAAGCLFLFEAAGGKAVESGFVSRNNDDATAERFFKLNDGVLDREKTISWNIVPWALRENGKNRKPTTEEIEEGLCWLNELVSKLPNLRVVVLCGDHARKATAFLYTKRPELHVLHAPHPAPQSMLQPGKKKHLRAAIEKAARLVESGG